MVKYTADLESNRMNMRNSNCQTELQKFEDEYVGKDIDARRHPEEQIIPQFKNSFQDPLFKRKTAVVAENILITKVTGIAPQNDVLKSLKLDYILIDEAIRRMKDGTCCLQGEEKDSIYELFEKTNQAIIDHITIEEEGFLPQFEIEKASQMRHEHFEMKALLSEARHTLLEKYPLSFGLLLGALKTSLNKHKKIESNLFSEIKADEIQNNAIESVRRRVSNNIV